MSESTASATSLRHLMRAANHATLATIAIGHKQVTDGWPVTSMVVPAIYIDGTPLLLISELADHTRHILADNRVSLLFTPPPTLADGAAMIETDTARLTVFGRAVRDDTPGIRACYLRANPDAAQYARFADFGFYRVSVDAAYWVGGFGKQRRLLGDKLIPANITPLIDGHDGIVAHMNADHADALSGIVGRFTTADPNAGWQMQSIDCDGMVLIANSVDIAPLRIDFPTPVRTPDEAREILVKMCKIWRA
ncbi:pyridoxamine 5'-phosphate oxidase [Thalassospira tepidiphila]|uniref:HugZ family pyridoxamine 5'-phosphate oxidase n=1 Tax=Thalassospira tepidiphila TaxID=393657 RepID=UPI00292139B5|nr:pyridoxamine 5'-phosphate oxidase [Thalassospira tepidiphila]